MDRRHDSLLLELTVGSTLQWQQTDLGDGARVEYFATYADLAACARLGHWGRFSAGPCGALAAGIIIGRGLGMPLTGTRARPWVGPRLGPTLCLRLGPETELQTGVSVTVPVIRPRFFVAGWGRVHEPQVAWQAALGLTMRL
jgi:hypothetical protein